MELESNFPMVQPETTTEFFYSYVEAEHIQTKYEQKQHNIYLNISSTTLNMAGWQAAASGCKGKDHEKVKYQKHFINNDSLVSGK